MNTQNENTTKQDLKQDLLEAKIDALISMTRATTVLLILVLTIFLGSASFQTRTDKRTEAIFEKLDSNLSK